MRDEPFDPGRNHRFRTAAPLVAGAVTLVTPAVPVGRWMLVDRLTVGGQIGGAVIVVYHSEVNDDCIIDADNVAPGGIASVFEFDTKVPLGPGSSLVVAVSGAGAGEAAVNLYWRDAVIREPREHTVPDRAVLGEPIGDAPAGDVDLWPATTDEDLTRAGAGVYAAPPDEPYYAVPGGYQDEAA
jgi:hypothetical protein